MLMGESNPPFPGEISSLAVSSIAACAVSTVVSGRYHMSIEGGGSPGRGRDVVVLPLIRGVQM